MYISSLNNEKVKYWEKLKVKKYRDREKLFLIESTHLVMEALNLGILKEIITTEEKEYAVPTYQVSMSIMKKLSSQTSSTKIIGVAKLLEEKEIEGNILLLDNLQDPGNLGCIIRSACAFNFKTIILSNTCVDLYNPKVIRATEGMLFHVNIIRGNLLDIIKNLSKDYLLVTTDVCNGKDIKTLKYKNIAIVIGNEGSGVSEEVSSLCQEKVNIKMTNVCESLNASVSASILMYEVYHE